MVTKWQIEPRLSDNIEAIEVVAETACFVTIKTKDWRGEEYEIRLRKDGSYPVFDTFDAAKEALVEDALRRLKHAESELQRAKDRLKRRNDIKTRAIDAAMNKENVK